MKYILYKKYLKSQKVNDEQIFFSKTSDGFLIGPKINDDFDEYSFYKRVISSSVYNKNKYKSCLRRKASELIEKYEKHLKNNEVIEILKNGEEVKHKIVSVPGGNYDEKQVNS